MEAIAGLLLECEKYDPSFCNNDDIRVDSDPVVGEKSSSLFDDVDTDSEERICSMSLLVASNGTDWIASKLKFDILVRSFNFGGGGGGCGLILSTGDASAHIDIVSNG